MRRLRRPPISTSTARFLAARTKTVVSAANPALRAKELWGLRRNKAFQEIAKSLRDMASGVERCMYCEDSQGTAIDHFRPKASYPQHAYEWDNYFLACSHCNSNEKRDQFPLDSSGSPLLVDPAREDPHVHLQFSPTTGKLVPLTAKGTATRDVFGLDRGTLVRGRTAAWVGMQALLVRYDALLTQQRTQDADALKNALTAHPFSAVLMHLIRMSVGPGALLIDADCLAVLRARPEIASWI